MSINPLQSAMQPETDNAIDMPYLTEVCQAIGYDAMAVLIQSFLRDCIQSADRISGSLERQDLEHLPKEAHRLSGMLAQFGCPRAARGFREAARCAPTEIAAPLARSIETLRLTRQALEQAFQSMQ